MLTTPHVLLGLYLAHTYSPWIGLPAALASHFIFDFFYPHWNPHLFTEHQKMGTFSHTTWRIIRFDLLVASVITLLVCLNALPDLSKVLTLLAGAFLATLPDLLEMPYYLFQSQHPLLKRLVTFEHHHQARANVFWGVLSQLVVIGLCGWGLLV